MRARGIILCCLLALLPRALVASGLEVTLTPDILQVIVERNFFKQSGRLYVEGGPTTPCYLFLEGPRVYFDGLRVSVAAHLTGRAGVAVGENCIGVGESIDVVLSGKPFVQSARIGLKEIRIATARYESLVARALQIDESKTLEIDVAAALRKALQSEDLQLYHLAVGSVALGDPSIRLGAIRLSIDVHIGPLP